MAPNVVCQSSDKSIRTPDHDEFQNLMELPRPKIYIYDKIKFSMKSRSVFFQKCEPSCGDCPASKRWSLLRISTSGIYMRMTSDM